MSRRAVYLVVSVVCVFVMLGSGLFVNGSKAVVGVAIVLGIVYIFVQGTLRKKAWVLAGGLVVVVGVMYASVMFAMPLWLSFTGRTVDCEVVSKQEVRTSKYGRETRSELRCGDRDLTFTPYREPVGAAVGGRTSVVVDSAGLVSAVRPGEVHRLGLIGLPATAVLAIGFTLVVGRRPRIAQDGETV
ncbi:hypothetical protein GCM10022243_08250 [Saccharothrix violaceirubra]|uniref:Uncharacterized protein n=1 Tax=Saccharothrix violaceirubra TaxID=413306 RepID=A0A7W7SZK4_9PSEU|nr:hypothetical protein [Saccharothrix violaceirubra]MBB4963237.1 hypothetical protein [Saccharothrix violaceirubra]